jgi:hypothetical protein
MIVNAIASAANAPRATDSHTSRRKEATSPDLSKQTPNPRDRAVGKREANAL